MIRLLQIEWLKVKTNPSFWVLLLLYGVSVYMFCSLGTVLMNATIESYSSNGSVPELPSFNIYEFPDIWHNLTYLASFLKIFLGILIILSISNERAYRTLRQNIIDGLSPLEFLSTKLLKILGVSVMATVFLFGVIYYFGIRYSDQFTWEYANRNIEFMAAFFIQVLSFMTMSMFIAFLVRSVGLAIVFTIAYSFFIETILKWIFLDSDGLLASLLPVQALDNLIQAPFNLINPEAAQTQVESTALIIVLAWAFVFSTASFVLLKKRDL